MEEIDWKLSEEESMLLKEIRKHRIGPNHFY